METVKFTLKDGAVAPYKATEGSAAADLYAYEDCRMLPGERCLIKTGVSIQLPEGYCALLLGRSGNTIRKGLVVAQGLIDSDYRGEIGVMAFNFSGAYLKVSKGDRVGQLLVLQLPPVSYEQASALDATERGSGGFGHTGN